MNHLKITQAGLVALLTAVVGQLVAFVPALAADKQILISAGSTVIATGFLIANAIHALVASKVTAKDLEDAVPNLVKAELGKVNFDGLVRDLVGGANIGALVKQELNSILAAGLQTPPSTAPVSNVPVGQPAPVPPAG